MGVCKKIGSQPYSVDVSNDSNPDCSRAAMASLFTTVIGSRTEGNASSTNGTNASTDSGDDHSAHTLTKTILFLFLAFAIGAAVRYLLKRTPLPYTVVLIMVGLLVGGAPKWQLLSFLQDYIAIAQLDPHLMLLIFLPTLIFESAFVMDVHTFKKTIGQVLILAGPGLLISAFLTSLMARYVFPYNWSWVVALLFGILLSATDPVAVVALLKELGASKQLGTIIEGESLLNDGAAIVIFNVLVDELIPGKSRNGLQIFLYFLQVALGGPAFGYFMAKATIFWLSRVFNDALVEIAITLASTYITFYIGEELLGVSGVLAVVTLGIEINSHRSNISAEVEVFLHRFWEVLGYLANTLIFVLVGVVISQRAFEGGLDLRDWMFLIALYLTIIVIRLVVTGSLQPILTRIGYSIGWRHTVMISWGGLRGAVGLALALVVAQTSSINFDLIGSKVLFHTAGIVVLTLIINGTSTKYLLKGLGMSDVSFAHRKTMSTAVARLNEAKYRAINMLKSDRFLADASWNIVEKSTKIVDPYKHLDKKEFTAKPITQCQCDHCVSGVPHVLNRNELAELAEEVRLRVIKAEKTSYWRQFEQGMLGREAVRILSNLADSAMDTPNRLIVLKDLAPNWRIPTIFNLIRRFLEWVIVWKSSTKWPPPANRFLMVFYRIADHFVFEWFVFGVIFLNCVCTVIEVIITDSTGLLVLRILNYIACGVYVLEAVIKMIGLRLYYWLSKWNLFDIFILFVCLVEIAIEIAFPMNSYSFSPGVLRIVRILRIGRLVKLMLPRMVKLIDYFVNQRLRLGYDIGRGFVVAEEELLRRFDRIMQVNQDVAEELKKRLECTHLEVIRSLGLIRKEHPGVALSIKTDQATRSVLNNCQDNIKQLLSGGLLDEIEADRLLQSVEMKIKNLGNGKSSLLPPNPDYVFHNLPWLHGLDPTAIGSLRDNAEMRQFDTEDFIMREGEQADGIYIIMSGLVRVLIPTKPSSLHQSVSPDTSEEETEEEEEIAIPMEHQYMIVDFFGAGTVLGEMATLLNMTRNASVECETDVQAFYIPGDKLNESITSYPELEERLWRICGIRVAVNILAKLAKYQDWPTSKLSLMCESSFIVSAHHQSNAAFEVTDQHHEVILVSGEVRCINTREIFMSPCVIPKNVKHILMRAGNPRLLVITNDFTTVSTNKSPIEDDEYTVQSKWRATVQSYIWLMVASLKEKATLSWLEKKVTSLDNWWRRRMGRRSSPTDLEEHNGPPTAFAAPGSNAELASGALPSYQHTSQLVNRPALARDTEPDTR